MSRTRRSVLGTAAAGSATLAAGCLSALDVDGDEPNYISISNRHEEPVTIDVTVTNVDTGDIVYDEALEFDGFAGADEDGSSPSKRPDLGVREEFEATVTAATDQDSAERTDDINPSGGVWISILHKSNAELSISANAV